MRGETAISKRRVKGVIKYSFIIAILLYISLFSMAPCKAGIIWSDDFDDRDYDGWIVVRGVFSAEKNILNATSDGCNIVYLSPVTTGTWSFDTYITSMGESDIAFMASEDEYEIRIFSKAELYRVIGGTSTRIVEYRFPRVFTGWQHFDITRNQDGRICVYHNDTLIIDTVDNSVSISEYFGYRTVASGGAIDNIVVSNTIDIEPPPQIPFYMQIWFLEAVGAIAVAAAVIIVFLGRRKH